MSDTEKYNSDTTAPASHKTDGPQRDRLLGELIVRAEKYGNGEDAPAREVLGMLGDKWSPLILLILRCGTFRHAELNRIITRFPGSGAISQRMLTLKLRGLERVGLVSRVVFPEVPPRVNYSLTSMGQDFMTALMPVYDFLDSHDADIYRSVVSFDNERISHDEE